MTKEYTIFENMKLAAPNASPEKRCDSEENKLFIFLATSLAQADISNPFKTKEGQDKYFEFMYFYNAWKTNERQDCAIRRRFLREGLDLCKVNEDNPF